MIGRTVNQHCYLEILARLREAVRRRRPELWPDAWITHLDNAPAHDTLAVLEFLAKKIDIEVGPPYSPDLAPCDFWLFPKLKTALKGRHLGTCDDLPERIPEEEFQKCFDQWKHRLTKCICAQGDYFKGVSNHKCVSN
jgi:hypothetical protein